MSDSTEYWGISSSIELYDCDLALMQNAAAIREFVRILCDRIKMKRYGETQVVHFGEDPRVTGFSMTQLIETSLISAYFADSSCAIYLDVFSCAAYEPNEVAQFAREYFKAATCDVNVAYRK